jgi:hypothetical protein
MKLNARNIQQIQGYLRNTAEVDANDVIANAASQLAVDLEYVRVPFEFNCLSEAEQSMVHYAIQRRERYVLRDGARHAVDLERIRG